MQREKTSEKDEILAEAGSAYTNSTSEVVAEEAESTPKAVLLWNSGTYSAPSTKEGKWVASYQFGNTFTLTGKTEENESEKRTYVEVIGPDGKTGWINQYLIVPNASVGVATSDVILYKNPDIMSVSSDKVKLGEIIAISSEEKDGFSEIFGKEKKVKGYINSKDKISTEPLDLKVAVLYNKAMAAASKEEQLAGLKAISEDPSNTPSIVYSLVSQKLDELMGVNKMDEELEEAGDMIDEVVE
ncbi:MAG TPA: hypothetical protein VIK89_08325 [Cytophagaceae bacterium]